VVDDEPTAREIVRSFLADELEVEVVGEAGNGVDAVELVRRLRPDLLFLDVQMPDRDGFGVLEALAADEIPPGVVFVTAHDEHALRAFEVHALDYVLKPFGRPRFRAAVGRALRRLAAEDALAARRTLAALLDGRRAAGSGAGVLTLPGAQGSPTRPRRLGVRVGTRTVLVDADEVDWAEADGDYVRLHAGGKVHLLAARMHALEDALGERFQRIHRSILVNLDRVRELHREADGGGHVLLRSDVRLRVARSRWEALEEALGLDG
jgi:two-component system LytT family response regulator